GGRGGWGHGRWGGGRWGGGGGRPRPPGRNVTPAGTSPPPRSSAASLRSRSSRDRSRPGMPPYPRRARRALLVRTPAAPRRIEHPPPAIEINPVIGRNLDSTYTFARTYDRMIVPFNGSDQRRTQAPADP